jgi:DHA2 family multidrug resistance protein
MASLLFMPPGRISHREGRSAKASGCGFSGHCLCDVLDFELHLGVASSNFWLPLTVQGAGLGLIFVPLTTVTNDPIPRERMGNATSIFNLMRNIGASIGIAMVETMQVRKSQLHLNILGEHVNPANPLARQTVDRMRGLFMSQGKDAVTATRQAYGAVWGMVQQQAAMLAYNDVFRFLALTFVALLPLLFLMRKPTKGGAVMAH